MYRFYTYEIVEYPKSTFQGALQGRKGDTDYNYQFSTVMLPSSSLMQKENSYAEVSRAVTV